MKPVSIIVTVFLVLVSLMHLLRFVFQVEVLVGNTIVPMWVSLPACLVTAGLAVLLWREQGPDSG